MSPTIRLYYSFKPLIPRKVRLWMRRAHARRIVGQCSDVWPILPAAAHPPKNWPGWPAGNRFAFVLTHDVEGEIGLNRVRILAELERTLGFRSSFNFIPQGTYDVPGDLVAWLTENGFEVGVHDLRHNGKLLSARSMFRREAALINRQLRLWNAVGFRAGFMLRNLDWFHDLEIAYDASTFDTDPFEPQPDGAGTIFPFWVPKKPDCETSNTGRTGYVELPYTLPQDFTLFALLRHRSTELWTRKLGWIVEHGGMALVNVHPDYIDFDGTSTDDSQYPVQLYKEFLLSVRAMYDPGCWFALPREVASYYRSTLASGGD